jgi:hypothetical protein
MPAGDQFKAQPFPKRRRLAMAVSIFKTMRASQVETKPSGMIL